MPKLSIIMASYNHEKFVSEAVQSVLNQSFQDFELIIIDDASTDHTVNQIKKFNDTRIKLTVLEKNQGQYAATNIGIKKAKGEYIGILNSDDAFLPEKLAKQVAFLDHNPSVGAVFSYADVVYENKHFSNKLSMYSSIFNQKNRSRTEWLNYFFFYGNCLCHPSVLIRSKCHDEVGLYDERFANCSDFQFWVRLVAKYDIHIIEEKLTLFRILNKNGNMSGNSYSSLKRVRFEDYQAKLPFFNDLLLEEDFFLAFPDAKKYISTHKHAPLLTSYLLARLALDTKDSYFEALGLRIIFELMQDSKTRKQLSEDYNFQNTDLIQWTGRANPFQMRFLKKNPVINSVSQTLKTIYYIHKLLFHKIIEKMNGVK